MKSRLNTFIVEKNQSILNTKQVNSKTYFVATTVPAGAVMTEEDMEAYVTKQKKESV